MARREWCRQVHSALTQEVNVIGASKLKHGAAFKKTASGQLPFLLLRPNEVSSRITHAGVLKVAHHPLRVVLKHLHVIMGRFA